MSNCTNVAISPVHPVAILYTIIHHHLQNIFKIKKKFHALNRIPFTNNLPTNQVYKKKNQTINGQTT